MSAVPPWYEDDNWPDDEPDDPPLYPAGKLAGMSLEELDREHDRQADMQGRLGDAEHIDEAAVARAEARCSLVEREIKRRKKPEVT